MKTSPTLTNQFVPVNISSRKNFTFPYADIKIQVTTKGNLLFH